MNISHSLKKLVIDTNFSIAGSVLHAINEDFVELNWI